MSVHVSLVVGRLMLGIKELAYITSRNIEEDGCLQCMYRSMVTCQKGPTRHAYARQIGPFWQVTLDDKDWSHPSRNKETGSPFLRQNALHCWILLWHFMGTIENFIKSLQYKWIDVSSFQREIISSDHEIASSLDHTLTCVTLSLITLMTQTMIGPRDVLRHRQSRFSD